MTDQAQAVESDPLERMMANLEEEESPLPDDESASDEPETPDEETEADEEAAAPETEEEWEEIVHEGETRKLSKTELKELAQKGFDYTQKTQQLAEQRRYIEAQEIALKQQAEMQAQFTDQIAQAKSLQSQLEQWKGVNWTELAQSDPMQYLSLHHQYQEAKEAYQAQIQNLNVLHQQAQQTAAAQREQRLQQEAQAMRQAIPEWKDSTRAQSEMTEIRSFLTTNGFTPGEVDSVVDHRHVVIARKAMMFDKLMAQGKQKVNNPPPVPKPGSTAKPNNPDVKKAREALKKTGRGDLAAKLIERML